MSVPEKWATLGGGIRGATTDPAVEAASGEGHTTAAGNSTAVVSHSTRDNCPRLTRREVPGSASRPYTAGWDSGRDSSEEDPSAGAPSGGGDGGDEDSTEETSQSLVTLSFLEGGIPPRRRTEPDSPLSRALETGQPLRDWPQRTAYAWLPEAPGDSRAAAAPGLRGHRHRYPSSSSSSDDCEVSIWCQRTVPRVDPHESDIELPSVSESEEDEESVRRWCPPAPGTCGSFGRSRMGNGASAGSGSQVVLDGGEALDVAKIRALVPELRQQLKQRDLEVERLQEELQQTRASLLERDSDLSKLKGEVHKLKSVLQVTVHKDGKPDILSTIHEQASMAGQETGRNKKQGVSGESSSQSAINIKHFDKDFRLVFGC